VVSVIAVLSVRVGVELLTFKPIAQVGVVTPQPTAPEGTASAPKGADSLVGRLDSSSAPVASQEAIGTNVVTPHEPAQDSQQPLPTPSSLLREPREDAALAGPGGELNAPGKVHSAVSPEKKQKRSKRHHQYKRDEEAQPPAKEDATSAPMLACARIEVLRKRLDCFDKLKHGKAEAQ
jgi:hypothetical protein